MILLSHPTANQNVRQTALAFTEAELLAEFWTGIHWERDGLLDRCAAWSPRIRRELRRRSFPAALAPFLRTVPFREWGRLVAGQLGWEFLTRNEAGVFCVDAVYHALDQGVAERIAGGFAVGAVYAYDDGALRSFRAARERGIKCIYEHPTVAWRMVRRLQTEEAELRPEWASTLGALRDSEKKLARKDEELSLADVVVTASSFARDSLKEAPSLHAPVAVIPYGTQPNESVRSARSPGRKLRILFVGSLTQAKGLGYLLEAVEALGEEVELTLVGRRVSAIAPTAAQLGKHRWIPSLAHDDLLREMEQRDVLVLPSLHEGFGLVLGEAMSCGLTVITTAHTGGPDLFTDGVEGFIVPIRSADAIEEKLAILRREPDRLGAMQEAAREKARAGSWENYRQRLQHLAREVMV